MRIVESSQLLGLCCTCSPSLTSFHGEISLAEAATGNQDII